MARYDRDWDRWDTGGRGPELGGPRKLPRGAARRGRLARRERPPSPPAYGSDYEFGLGGGLDVSGYGPGRGPTYEVEYGYEDRFIGYEAEYGTRTRHGPGREYGYAHAYDHPPDYAGWYEEPGAPWPHGGRYERPTRGRLEMGGPPGERGRPGRRGGPTAREAHPPYQAGRRRGGDYYGAEPYPPAARGYERSTPRSAPRYGPGPADRWPADTHWGPRPDYELRLRDEEIQDAVYERLFHDTWVDPEGIDVRVEDGVVTLSGDVGDFMEARYAWDDAWESPGVRGVINNLTISTT